jgi:HEPN domain-containing protein
MKDKILNQQEQIIDRIKSLLEVKYVFKSIETTANNQVLFIVILNVNCSSLTKELSSMVAKIFQEETDFLYRIFSFEYAQQQLIEENLFFVNGCNWNNIVYYEPSSKLDVFFEYYPNEKLLSRIEENFHKEHSKIIAFLEGAQFYIEKDNLKQSAFMLQQCIELWFRFAALLAMGKERKSHSIKELQTYIKSYVPELGNLFDCEKEEEQGLLKLVDDAYVVTRYESSYEINSQKIEIIKEKANRIELVVTHLFNNLFDACKNNINNSDYDTNQTSTESIDFTYYKFINSLSEKDFSSLKPYPHKKGLYTIGVMTLGYLETSFMISNLLKVCILAMEYEYAPTRSIPDPTHNVKEVLGYVLDMIPHEEMELLDVLRDLTIPQKS